MVRITIKAIEQLKNELNAELAEDNGTKFVNFAYEEVLFPLVLAAKKKYWGIPHIGEPNFNCKDLFIRGIDVIKQGQTEYMKEVGLRIMWEAMSVNNTKDLGQIVEDSIRWAIHEKKWNFDDFVAYESYRPNRDNKAVQRFVQRMRIKHEKEIIESNIANRESKGSPSNVVQEYLFNPPEPGEKFKYVIVNPQSFYNLKGNTITYNKGDMMEYVNVAKKLNLPINIEYYMESKVLGMCARMVSYKKEFLHEREIRLEAEGKLDDCTKEEFKSFDDYSVKAGKKYLKKFISSIGTGARKSKELSLTGKRSYKAMMKTIEEKGL